MEWGWGGARYSAPSRTALGPTQPPIRWEPGHLRGVNRPGCGDDHPPPSSADVKERMQLYLYSPYWPYGLYRASVPVQYSYTSTPPIGRTTCTEPQCLYRRAIPLLPLLAVGPAQKPQCLYSTAIPLLPLLAVQPVQNLSACTRVHINILGKRQIHETCVLLQYHTGVSGNFVPTFRDNLSVLSSRVESWIFF